MSLVMPESFTTYKVLSLDPGINFTGISIYTLNHHNEILSIEAFTVRPDIKDVRVPYDMEVVGERYLKLMSLKQIVTAICRNNTISVTVCEGPFYSRFRPMAYASLIETLNYIKMGLYDYDAFMSMTVLQPLLIKKIIGAGTMKGKIDVTKSVKNHSVIMDNLLVDIEKLDEHAIDAIAIGYSYLQLSGVPSCMHH